MHVFVAAEGQKGESSQVELAGEGGWAEWASLAVRVQLEGESSAQDGYGEREGSERLCI